MSTDMARAPSAQEQALKHHWRGVLEADRARLLLAHPFTALIALNLEIVPVLDPRLSTAATDGKSLFFQVKFLAHLSESARVFVLAHEVWHVVCGHLKRRQTREPECWNIAVDHEVNALLRRDGLTLPGDAVYFASLDGHSAETVYEWLQARQQTRPPRGQVQFDQHGVDIPGDRPATAGEAIHDPAYNPQPIDAHLTQVWRERVVSVAQSLRSRGQLPAKIQQYIDQLVSPQLPWHQLMRQFTQRVYGGRRSWLPPARRHIYRGLYLPGMRTDALRVSVAIDTSGSTERDLPTFMGELQALLGEFDRIEVTLIECDVSISRTRVLTENDLHGLGALSLVGGGGTDLRPPFEHLRTSPPECLVYLTDGHGPAPSQAPSFPVLWVITANGDAPADWGQVVFMPPSPRRR